MQKYAKVVCKRHYHTSTFLQNRPTELAGDIDFGRGHSRTLHHVTRFWRPPSLAACLCPGCPHRSWSLSTFFGDEKPAGLKKHTHVFKLLYLYILDREANKPQSADEAKGFLGFRITQVFPNQLLLKHKTRTTNSQPTSQPASQPTNQPASHPASQSASQPPNQPTNKTTKQQTNQQTKQPTNQLYKQNPSNPNYNQAPPSPGWHQLSLFSARLGLALLGRLVSSPSQQTALWANGSPRHGHPMCPTYPSNKQTNKHVAKKIMKNI